MYISAVLCSNQSPFACSSVRPLEARHAVRVDTWLCERGAYSAALSLSFRLISILISNVNEHNSLGSPGNALLVTYYILMTALTGDISEIFVSE